MNAAMTDAAVLGIGWLQGTTRTADREALTARLGSMFGEVKARQSGLNWYREAVNVGALGVVVGWEPRSSSSAASEVLVTIPQSAFDALGWVDGLAFLREMVKVWGVRPSRLDVYADDLARVADPTDVLAAMKAGQVRTHVQNWRQVSDSNDGMTVYIGSRSGECMVRVYRKWAESGDPDAGVRWEMEARGARAAIVAELLLTGGSAAVAFVAVLRYFVDFVDRGKGEDLSTDRARGDRAPLLAWWSALVGNVERAGWTIVRVVDSIERKRAWIRRQVGPTLALLFHVDGSQGVLDMIREGWDRAPWGLLAGAPRWIEAPGTASA